MKAQWRGRVDFHEFAEALEIDTDMVLAMLPTKGVFAVIYTLDPNDETTVRIAILARDEQGVLKVKQDTPHPDFFAGLKEAVGKSLEEQLGPPTGGEQ